jgi:enolase
VKISKVLGYQVLDSRGRPTVAAAISLDDGTTHTARVPSGASTGKHEAKELRDRDSKFAENFYGGLSVQSAIANINEKIAPSLVAEQIDLNLVDARLIELDSTSDHSLLGANATLAVSMAASLATAHCHNESLARYFSPDGPLQIPMPMVNILSGGAHANRSMDIQDVLIMPVGAKSFTEALSWIVAVREMAAKLGKSAGQITNLIADEGGLAISFSSIEKACQFVVTAIEKVGLNAESQVNLALDIAASQFYDGNNYNLATLNKSYNRDEYLQLINSLVGVQPIISIEDPFAEDDWQSWQEFSEQMPPQLQLVGDDLLTTNLGRLNKAIAEKSANAILIKPNQNGLITATLNVLNQARANNFKTVVSARSGESEDAWLADLAVGWRAGQIKVGSTHGSERNAKWNRLLEFEATESTEFSNPLT